MDTAIALVLRALMAGDELVTALRPVDALGLVVADALTGARTAVDGLHCARRALEAGQGDRLTIWTGLWRPTGP